MEVTLKPVSKIERWKNQQKEFPFKQARQAIAAIDWQEPLTWQKITPKL